MTHFQRKTASQFCWNALARNFTDRIARTPNGADDIRLVALVDRFSKTSDMDVHGPFVDVDRLAPDIVEQLGTREDAAGMLHEEFEKAEFRGPKRQLVSVAVGPMGFTIEHDAANGQHRREHFGL